MNSQTQQTTNVRTYVMTYAPSAPKGLPPVMTASRTFTYSDEEGTWFAAVMDAPSTADRTIPHLVLRLPAADVVDAVEYADMTAAIAASGD